MHLLSGDINAYLLARLSQHKITAKPCVYYIEMLQHHYDLQAAANIKHYSMQFTLHESASYESHSVF